MLARGERRSSWPAFPSILARDRSWPPSSVSGDRACRSRILLPADQVRQSDRNGSVPRGDEVCWLFAYQKQHHHASDRRSTDVVHSGRCVMRHSISSGACVAGQSSFRRRALRHSPVSRKIAPLYNGCSRTLFPADEYINASPRQMDRSPRLSSCVYRAHPGSAQPGAANVRPP